MRLLLGEFWELGASRPDFALVVEDDGEELADAEVRPVAGDELDLCVGRALPEHEIAEAPDPRGTHENVERGATRLGGHEVRVDG